MKRFTILPLVTEKSLALAEQGHYQFIVPTWANKQQIADLAHDQFNVTVMAVTTARLPEEQVRFRNKPGTRPSYKKATVRLKAGERITDFSLPAEAAQGVPQTPQTEAIKDGAPVTDSTITVRSKSKKSSSRSRQTEEK